MPILTCPSAGNILSISLNQALGVRLVLDVVSSNVLLDIVVVAVVNGLLDSGSGLLLEGVVLEHCGHVMSAVVLLTVPGA